MTRETTHGKRFIVAQVGARMHYAVPRILFQRGLLERFYTDVYFPSGHWSSFWVGKLLSKNAAQKIARYRTDIPDDIVRFNNFHGLATKSVLARNKNALQHARAGILGAQRLTSRIKRNEINATDFNIYGFDTASAELFAWAGERGGKTVLEQCIAPRSAHKRLLSRARLRAGLETPEFERAAWDFLGEREREEWRLSNLIICPSDFVQGELIQDGVAPEKIAVVPYGVAPNPEATKVMAQRNRKSNGPLRVLFAGELGLRKGILDLWEAAGRLNSQDYEFVAAGRVGLPEPVAAKVARRTKILGKCTRAQMAEEYARADCFVLPSHLEGSATVTYEALSWGLPVITTFAAGSVVEDGVSGFVGESGDVDFLERSLLRLRADATLRGEMAQAAQARSEEFTVERYGERLVAALENLTRRRQMDAVAVDPALGQLCG